MNDPSPGLCVQINQVDYVLTPPGPLDASTLPQVPVIRIYGPSSTGQKACVLVHQVYPYFYVEYMGEMDPDNVNRYISKLWQSLNHAIAISLKRNPHSPTSHYIRSIFLVKGVHFYGFHSAWSPFLKVVIGDPALMHRAVTIMRSGTVMQTQFRIYESHLSFILQFMSDFGLYGCGWIELSDALVRGDEEHHERATTRRYHDGANDVVEFESSPHHRQSRMQLEVDVAAYHILNRHRLAARSIHHKLEIPAPPLPKEPLVLSVRELWEDERNRRVEQGLSPSPELPNDPSEGSRAAGGAWVAEARLWDELRERIERDSEKEPALSTRNTWERWVMTTFESVEALWDERWRVWKPGGDRKRQEAALDVEKFANPYATAGVPSSSPDSRGRDYEEESDVDVDEAKLSSQDMVHVADQDETDWGQLLAEARELVECHDRDPLEDEDLLEPRVVPLQGEEEDDQPKETHPNIHKEDERQAEEVLNEPSTLPTHATHTLARSRAREALASTRDIPDISDICSTSSHSDEEHGPATPVGRAKHLDKTPIVKSRRALPLFVTEKPASEVGGPRPLKLRRVDFSDTDGLESFVTTSAAASSPSSRPSASFFISDSSISPLQTSQGTRTFLYAKIAPTTSELLSSMDHYGIPSKIYRSPHYSKAADAPERPREYAGLMYHLKGGSGLSVLEPWANGKNDVRHPVKVLDPDQVGGWEFASCPPSVKVIKHWLKTDIAQRHIEKTFKSSSQIVGPTQANPYGFKSSRAAASSALLRQRQSMSVLSLEVFSCSSSGRVPNPDQDEINAVFYAFQDIDVNHAGPLAYDRGHVVVESRHANSSRIRDFDSDVVSNELDLINRIVDIIVDLDPDIVIGWEVQVASWGYLSARGRYYGYEVAELISRAKSQTFDFANHDQWGTRHTSTFKVVGRHVLNLWRIVRSEHNLSSYTLENIAFHFLRRRIPNYSPSTLTRWYSSEVPAHTARVLRYFRERTSVVLEIMNDIDVVTKTAEFARVFGIDFFSVISRGSQFKVESFMSRIAKPESFVLLSPSKDDVGKQNAAECMPLIMEPLSAFYNSPLLVLDFQSLYPSVMIAYNYCYSTCLGRVIDFKGRNKFGVTELNQPAGLLRALEKHIHVAPNGIIYVNKDVRQGLLGRMLAELLDTRVMVKQAMKRVAGDKALKKVLDARQLGLKFIANVTYGYTSATFSGRMPAVEIADSIVQTGRETLEKAIQMIESNPRWRAKVVYGDTDSLFIYLPGRTKEQAFRVGYDIADAVTRANPSPIKLKFEKVYLPCVLMAKKRYVGFKYESPDVTEPVFDAKGIETVRRDGVPAQQKMTETCLKILFRTQDLSQVKEYCWSSWMKILDNRASVQDFIFAKEVRMGTYSNKGPPPPGVTVAARRMMEDENDEPQYGERVPYVIARGEPQARLVDRVVSPLELLDNRHLHIDAAYYISRVLIPPLERIFNLVGADVRGWYDEMPKTFKADHVDALAFAPSTRDRGQAGSATATVNNRFKIDEHFRSCQCLVCGSLAFEGICDTCRSNPQETISSLLHEVQMGEQRMLMAQRICASCTATAPAEPIECVSLDCPWLFERKRLQHRMDFLLAAEDRVQSLGRAV